MISRGDIRWFRFESPDKRRPVLFLGRQEILNSLTQIRVIPLSTQIRDLPWEVRLGEADGFPSESVLKPEWIKSVDRTSLGPQIATLPANRWTDVATALLHVLGLERAAQGK